MNLALPAKRKAPKVSGKPGELIGCLPGNKTPWGRPETAHFKDYPGRVKEGMFMGAMNRYFLILGSDLRGAFSAEDSLVGLFRGFILFKEIGPTIPWLLVDPKKIYFFTSTLHHSN